MKYKLAYRVYPNGRRVKCILTGNPKYTNIISLESFKEDGGLVLFTIYGLGLEKYTYCDMTLKEELECLHFFTDGYICTHGIHMRDVINVKVIRKLKLDIIEGV